jgi:alkanesulfonate monooxygenase SsuD/methylene tetrahydromethanopterin reductase-like flavin-dependent oxidoreductase (luciferase family)
MQFGLFSESGYRRDATTAGAYGEDLAEIVEADRLGFREAWIAETNRVRPNTVTDANLLIAKLGGLTSQIRFGTGIRQLPLIHPVNVVREANVCDHLTDGRYMLGYGGTHMASLDQAFQRGLHYEHADTRAAVYEAVELIMKCWSATEPFDFDGRFWHGEHINILPRPFQQPHPPIAAACSGTAETLELAARNGFIPLLSRGNDQPEEIRERGEIYLKAATASGRASSPGIFRVTYFVYVGESDSQAREDLREGATYILERRKRENPQVLEGRIPRGGTLDDLTYDYMVDSGAYWVGGPEAIYQRIKDYFDASHGFGVLLFAVGLPVASHELRLNSLRRFMSEVAPRLAHLGPAATDWSTVPPNNGAGDAGKGASYGRE